jgi:CheY-like chemotaxis protein
VSTTSEDPENGPLSNTVHVTLNSTLAPKVAKSTFGLALDYVRSTTEIIAKLLPGLALLIGLLMFRTEISDFLRHASKVEILGLKMEKGEFDQRLQAAGRALGTTSNQPSWTEVPFRKLNLAAPLLKGMRVLWVDDHPENNFFLRRILIDLDVQVVVALSNQEAIDKIRRNDFDIVISDFGRDPPLNETGGDLAKQLISIGYHAPLLFYTAQPNNVPKDLRYVLATNDPALLLSTIAELAIERRR